MSPRTIRTGRLFPVLVMLASALLAPAAVSAQTTGVLRGVVEDVQGGALPGATATVTNRVTGFELTVTTGPDGRFEFTNLPLDTYGLVVDLPGFAPNGQAVPIAANVPVELRVILGLAAQSETITVTPDAPLVDVLAAGTRTQISQERVAMMPMALGSRGIESVIVSFPGFAQNANGAIHPRGAHNQMTFVVDGLPISDQLTGAFANAIDSSIVQSTELITGNVPAEFGSKVSGVAIVTSRTGLGLGRSALGDVMVSAAGFNTWQTGVNVGGGGRRGGYFLSATGMRTDRFLDQVSLDNLHNDGGFARIYARLDSTPTDRDLVRVNAMGGRSAFELANLRSQHAAGQDQRQRLADATLWATYRRTLDRHSTLEATGGFRRTGAQLLPSAGDTPVTASQDRHLSNVMGNVRYTRMFGSQTLRAGADAQRFPVDETFSMAITSPSFNDPGADDFNPSLLGHDLTRGGSPFRFEERRAGRQLSAFVQATTRWRRVSLASGVRYDAYAFVVRGSQLQPRVGLSYELPGAAGVMRASYNRNYQTPPSENLLLSSSEAAAALAPESVRAALGGAYRPIHPEQQDVYELGYQRGLGRTALIDVSVYRKDSVNQQDNNNFFDTGIIFPTTLAAIRAEGAEMRLTLPKRAGVSASLSATIARAVSTPPFTGGLFLGQDAVDLLSAGPFRIDHDQRLSMHGTVQYRHPTGMWLGGSLRYDSGLVANPSDPAAVAADPDFFDLLPFVNLAATVPRVRPRTIADVVAGYDLRTAGRRTWSMQAQVTNLTNRTALYNFQSVFVGTRLVQPRTVAVRVTRHF